MIVMVKMVIMVSMFIMVIQVIMVIMIIISIIVIIKNYQTNLQFSSMFKSSHATFDVLGIKFFKKIDQI